MHALEIKNLKKTYASGFEALKGIDLTVEHGDFFALLGPNGAGKSTTIGLVSSMVKKQEGTISIYGYDVDKNPLEARAQLGLVAQEFNMDIFHKVRNVVQNCAGLYGIPRRRAIKKTQEVLTALGLWDKRDSPILSLSGGMKRRVMLAKALIHEPKLLILDEPTAGVDIELRRSMWEYLKEINAKGTTIILTTHYLEEAEQLCNKIAIIDKGEVIANEDKKTLLAKLNCETLVFDLMDPVAILPDLSPFEARLIDSSALEVDLCQGSALNDLFILLDKHNIKVTSMRNKANRLEELFMNLVETSDQKLDLGEK